MQTGKNFLFQNANLWPEKNNPKLLFSPIDLLTNSNFNKFHGTTTDTHCEDLQITSKVKFMPSDPDQSGLGWATVPRQPF